MPEDKYHDFLSVQQEQACSAATEEERLQALRRLFCAVLSQCAEAVLDEEMPPIKGQPTEPRYPVRSDSAYHLYHAARQTGFAGFTEEQRQVVMGLTMHTAFAVLDSILHRLDHFPGFQVGLSLFFAEDDLATEYRLRSLDTYDLIAARNGLPETLSKYEY